MGVILGNKYQSKQRDNFRKITGLSEANEKIKPENMPRIFGGIGEVWFQGNSPAGSSTGNGGDPNGGSGSGDPNGGGGSGGGGSYECICVDISEAESVVGIPCCITGLDCETGQPIEIRPNGEPLPSDECEQPPVPSSRCPVFIARPAHDDNTFILGKCEQAQSLLDDAMQQDIDYVKNNDPYHKYCEERELNPDIAYVDCLDCGGNIRVERKRTAVYYVWYTGSCEGASDYTTVYGVGFNVNNPENETYKKAVAQWKKRQPKKYFSKDGKFYNACDPYGEPPSEEPIKMCDTDGNQYSVSPDGEITPITD